MEAQGPQSSPCPCLRSGRKQDAHLCCFARAELQAPHLSGHPPLLVSTPSLPAPGWRFLPIFPSSRPLPAQTAQGVATQGPPRCWPFPRLSGREVQQGTQVAPAHAAVLNGHQLAHPQPGGHPQPLPPLGSLGKGLGHGSPRGRGEPRPFRMAAAGHDLTLRQAAGPQANALRWERASRCSDPSDGDANQAQRSGSHSLGLCWCHPMWPAGVMARPSGITVPTRLDPRVLAPRSSSEGRE